MKKWKLFWAPEGVQIAIVEATNESSAKKKAPQPYRGYPGEIYTEEILPKRSGCKHEQMWVPTFCNHTHCANCFRAYRTDHEDCRWNGSEHEDFGPASCLPGKVWIEGDTSKPIPRRYRKRKGIQ